MQRLRAKVIYFYFIQRNSQLIQLFQIFDLARLQENHGLALVPTPGSAPHSVHIIYCGARRVVLYNPVDIWHVDTPGSHVCANEDTPGGLAVLFEDFRALMLVHVAIEGEDVADLVR